MPQPDTLLLDYHAAAKMLGIGYRTLQGMVHRREIKFVRVGNRVLFSLESLKEWIREQEQLSSAR